MNQSANANARGFGFLKSLAVRVLPTVGRIAGTILSSAFNSDSEASPLVYSASHIDAQSRFMFGFRGNSTGRVFLYSEGRTNRDIVTLCLTNGTDADGDELDPIVIRGRGEIDVTDIVAYNLYRNFNNECAVMAYTLQDGVDVIGISAKRDNIEVGRSPRNYYLNKKLQAAVTTSRDRTRLTLVPQHTILNRIESVQVTVGDETIELHDPITEPTAETVTIELPLLINPGDKVSVEASVYFPANDFLTS